MSCDTDPGTLDFLRPLLLPLQTPPILSPIRTNRRLDHQTLNPYLCTQTPISKSRALPSQLECHRWPHDPAPNPPQTPPGRASGQRCSPRSGFGAEVPAPLIFLGAPSGRAELGQRGLGRPKAPLGPITKPNIYYCMVSILCNDYFDETECLTEALSAQSYELMLLYYQRIMLHPAFWSS